MSRKLINGILFSLCILLIAGVIFYVSKTSYTSESREPAQVPAKFPSQLAPQKSSGLTLPERRVFITVGQVINDKGGDFDPDWAAKKCFYLHSLVEYGRGTPTSATCMLLEDNDAAMSISFDPNSEFKSGTLSVSTVPLNKRNQKIPRSVKDIADIRKQGKFDYWINLVERTDRSFVLTVQNWKSSDDTDYRSSRWTINSKKGPLRVPVTREAQMTEIERILTKFVQFEGTRDVFKIWIMAEMIEQSKKVKIKDGIFIDAAGKVITADEAYTVFKEESVKQKHFLRTMMEISAILGMSTYAYWANPVNMLDFEGCTFWECLKYKFTTTKMFYFDDNALTTNGIFHTVAGTSYFLAARDNGYSAMESFMFTFASSAFWEFFSETGESSVLMIWCLRESVVLC